MLLSFVYNVAASKCQPAVVKCCNVAASKSLKQLSLNIEEIPLIMKSTSVSTC